MSQFHKLAVKEIQRVTDKAVSVSFTIPENLKELYSFKAGQYVTLRAVLEGEEVRRDYSLCSSPKSG
ncbi:MAG: FAD-binding oxidoreductase, partial [Desulfobulbia bacterium]